MNGKANNGTGQSITVLPLRTLLNIHDPYSPLTLSSNLSLNFRLRVAVKDDVILRYPHPYPYSQILRMTLRNFEVAPEVLKKTTLGYKNAFNNSLSVFNKWSVNINIKDGLSEKKLSRLPKNT